MTWRENFAPRIAEIIERVGRDDMKKLRKALSDAGSKWRGYWPYKVWCSEVNYQLGLKKRRLEQPTAQDATYQGKKLF